MFFLLLTICYFLFHGGEGTSKWRFGSSLVSCRVFYLLSLYFVKLINWQINWLIDWLIDWLIWYSTQMRSLVERRNCFLTHPSTCIWRLRWSNHNGFHKDLWCQTTRVPALWCGVEYVMILSRFDTTSACDRQTWQTYGRTPGHSIYRATNTRCIWVAR